MAEINGFNEVPQGRSGTGAAFVLGRTAPDALNILIAGQRARTVAAQREALAKQRAKDEDLKSFTSLLSTVKDDTGLSYGNQHMAEREVVGKEFLATATDATLTPQSKRLALDQIKTKYEQRGQMGKQVDDAMKLASGKAQGDNELDYTAVTKRLHDLQYDKDNNLLSVDQFPLRSMDNVLEDPKLFNTAKVYDNFVSSKVAPKETYQQATGGKPGTYSRSFTDEIRFLKKNADGSPYRDPVTHKTQTEITPELLEKAMENPRIKRDLDGLMADHKALTVSAETKMANLEPLTDEERAALEVEPNLTDLLGRRLSAYGYANHRETQRYNRYPRPASSRGGGASAGYLVPTAPTSFEGESSYNLTTDGPDEQARVQGAGPGSMSSFLYPNGYDVIKQTTKPSFAVHGQPLPRAVFQKKSGERSDVEYNFTPKQTMVPGEDGVARPNKYNGAMLSGFLGEGNTVYVDKKDGHLLNVGSRAEGEKMLLNGTAKLGLQIDYMQRKDQNYAANKESMIDNLMTEVDNNSQPKYKSRQQAEVVAQEALKKGLDRVPIMYDKDSAPGIDDKTGHYAKLYRDVKAEERRITAAGSQQQPTGKTKLRIGVAAPPAPATPTPTTKKASGMTGGKRL